MFGILHGERIIITLSEFLPAISSMKSADIRVRMWDYVKQVTFASKGDGQVDSNLESLLAPYGPPMLNRLESDQKKTQVKTCPKPCFLFVS